jgi:hypothetical protein
VRAWLADSMRRGLILVPPEEGWRAVLAAADVVIGDQGSVTCYAAAIGRPVLLASFPREELDPASAVAGLGRVAPRLRADRPAVRQLGEAVCARAVSAHHPRRDVPAADAARARERAGHRSGAASGAGPSASDVRSRAMMTGALPGRAVLALAWPQRTALIGWSGEGSGDAGSSRSGQDSGEAGCGWQAIGGEIVAAAFTASASAREIADVIYRPGPFTHARPGAWLGRVLSRHPGCGAAAVQLGPDTCLVGTRAGRPLMFSLRGHPGLAAHGALLSASFIYAGLTAGWAVAVPARSRLQVAGNTPVAACSAVPAAADDVVSLLSFGLAYGPGLAYGRCFPEPARGVRPASSSLRRT